MSTELSPDAAAIQPTVQPSINTDEAKPRKPLRLWPGIIGAALIVVGWFILPAISSSLILYGMLTELVGLVIVVAWWLFFSRAPWLERLGTLVLIVLALIITKRLVHESIAGGAMGALMYVQPAATLTSQS